MEESNGSAGTGYKRCVIQEGHDSIIQECDDELPVIWDYVQRTKSAFYRDISFHNGIQINIPVEAEISYDFNKTCGIKSKIKGTKKLDDITYQDVSDAYYKLKEHQEKERDATESS
jgi:cell division protein FtsX